MTMKRTLILSALFLTTLAAHAADPAASLYLKPKDIDHVALELEPDSNPQLRIFFSSSKLGETQKVVENNLSKPISLYMNDTLIVEPTLSAPLKSKIRYLTLTFNDFDMAAQVARGLVVTE